MPTSLEKHTRTNDEEGIDLEAAVSVLEEDARSRLTAAGVPLPHVGGEPVGVPSTDGDAESVERDEKAREVAAQREAAREAVRKRFLWIETPAAAAVCLLLTLITSVLGILPPARLVTVLRVLSPPRPIVRWMARNGWLGAESIWFFPLVITAIFIWIYLLVTSKGQGGQVTCRLAGMTWDRNNFCRGWLISGATGSGKTAAAIMHLFHEIFQNEKGVVDRKKSEETGVTVFQEYPWGGICVDEKGLFYQRLVKLCAHYERSHHLMLLQTRPDWADDKWRPPARFNLLGADHVPSNTYATNLVDTAQQVEGGGGASSGNMFFTSSAKLNIGWGIALCRAIAAREQEIMGKSKRECFTPNLKRVFEVLSSKDYYDEMLHDRSVVLSGARNQKTASGNETPHAKLGELLAGIDKPKELWTPSLVRLDEALSHFRQRYWSLPKETLGGIQGTITTYLSYFTNEEVAEVFCADDTFEFEEVDKGMILCVAMPQKLKVERRYVCTLLKLLFYTHVLRRFDREEESFKNKNLLVCWQDEAQRFVTPEDGNVDVIREAGATTVMGVQSKISLTPPLGGKEKANVTILNLRNRVIFRAADDDCATGSAEFLGKTRKHKKSWSTGKGGRTTSFSPEDTFKIQPYEFRAIKDLYAVVCHPNGKYKKLLIEPRDEEGKLPKWYKRPLHKKIGAALKRMVGIKTL